MFRKSLQVADLSELPKCIYQ